MITFNFSKNATPFIVLFHEQIKKVLPSVVYSLPENFDKYKIKRYCE